MVDNMTLRVTLNKNALRSVIRGAKLPRIYPHIYKNVIIDNNVTGLTTDWQQAADPSIVYDPSKKMWNIYFFASVGGHAEVYLCRSTDLLSMNYIGKVLSVGASGEWDASYVHKQAVILEDKFYMFYAGASGSVRAIGLATSEDGENFTKYENNPILTDPEGTDYLDAPTVFKWRDGNYYMLAYNGNGKNLIFRASNFPTQWEKIGELSSNIFAIYSTEAIYDEDLDLILVFANIYYPKPTPLDEPDRTGYIGLFICEEPTKCVYAGAFLPTLQTDVEVAPLKYLQRNVYAPAVVKVKDKYIMLFNANESGITTERIFRADLNDKPVTYNIKNHIEGITAEPYYIPLVRRPPGLGIKVKHIDVYAYAGTPNELYLAEGPETYTGRESIIAWTNTSHLERFLDVTIREEYLLLVVRGGSSTNSISIAYSVEVEFFPELL